MRVLVTGGRNYKQWLTVRNTLNEIHHKTPIHLIIQGGATGADEWARTWANRIGIPYLTCPAAWSQHGKAAGPIRNKAMLMWQPDLVLAFPGGNGTANMVQVAKDAGVEVREIT